MTRALDTSALTAPVARDEVRAWRQRAKASGAAWASPSLGAIVGFGVFGVVMLIMVSAFGSVFAGVVGGGLIQSPIGLVFVGFFVLVFGGVLVAATFGVLRAVGVLGGSWERWMRMDRFARANGFEFTPRSGAPSYPGAIFGRGSDRAVEEHLRSSGGRFLDIGSYRYTTGSGKSRTTHRWGFMAVHLDRRLPHMVLDSRANNGLFGGTNLPQLFDRGQVLRLEGDFDRYFTLYCPREYERDALYVFTPDLMALLIDEAAPFDVEIVDDWMFVYASGGFRTSDPALLTRLIRIVDTVGAKTVRQTARYADERVGDRAANIVAPGGRRLRGGVSIGAIVFMVVFALIWGWSFFGDGIASLLGR
jgi:hypothetical protein